MSSEFCERRLFFAPFYRRLFRYAFWSPFGSLLAPFCSLVVPFASLSAPVGSPLLTSELNVLTFALSWRHVLLMSFKAFDEDLINNSSVNPHPKMHNCLAPSSARHLQINRMSHFTKGPFPLHADLSHPVRSGTLAIGCANYDTFAKKQP